MKKNLPQLAIGRALNTARRAAKKSPRLVTPVEWKALKTMLWGGWKYKKVAKQVGRGVNTILRVKKSTTYDSYKTLLAAEVGARKKRPTKARPSSVKRDHVATKKREVISLLDISEQAGRYEMRAISHMYRQEHAWGRADDSREAIIYWLKAISMILTGIFITVMTLAYFAS